MKYVDEYRDPTCAHILAEQIRRTVTRPWVLMEICGGQTHTILRYGLDEMLPPEVELVHGPGCPVCVTPVETIDKAVAISGRPGVILVSYGDLLRVPGSRSDLYQARAAGADVRVVYSPMEALRIAGANPARQVVFLGIGFETTAPANAMAVWQARHDGVRNFSMLSSHVLVPAAIRMLLSAPDNRVQGLIAPGHVCTVMGYREYESIAADYGIPVVVGGFEPVDLLQAIAMLVGQLEHGRADVENQYARSVTRDGNIRAQQIMLEVFEVCDCAWRGIGSIASSGLRLRTEFAEYDADRVFDITVNVEEQSGDCIGALILQGRRKPIECRSFGVRCSPTTPLGAPMVSNEGACAAYYRYKTRAKGEPV